MIRSSSSPGAREARTVDELMAVEWDPEELHGGFEPTPAAAGVAMPDEQDDLIEAIATASAARESEREAEVERRVAEAYTQGYEEGRQDGEIAEGVRLRSALEAADEALSALRAGEQRWIGTIEENICALAVAVARHVIGRELQGDADATLGLVRRAVAEFPIDQPLKVRLSAQDHALISAACDGGEFGMAGNFEGREARWVADPMVAPGGCVVEGRERIVDGRVDAALERVYRRITYTHA
jgi:flagellar assembly protein FliH